MSENQWKRIDMYRRIQAGKLTGTVGAQVLGLSERQVRRVVHAIREHGSAGFLHGNAGHAPVNRLSSPLGKIIRLARKRYQGINDQHLTEKLVEVEGLSVLRRSVRRILRHAGVPAVRRRRPPKHRRRRDRKPQAGLMVLWDGSRHGGRSTRMGRDKAALQYGDKPQAVAAFELVARCCARTILSCRRDQPPPHGVPGIHDVVDNIGPMGGIVAAFAAHPDKAWLVVACDLPFLTEATLRSLMARRDPSRPATAFRSAHDGKPEPLCAIYEPSIADRVRERVARDEVCPRRALAELDALLLELPDPRALDNVNHPEEFEEARKALERR